MCDKCELDFLMYGEPVRHAPPVWEEGRFQAKAVEPDDIGGPKPSTAGQRKFEDAGNAGPGIEDSPDTSIERREQEN